ncbi:Dimodular nonribosomal peptide synthase [Paenibacillus solanacearum]|uniref:Dimodular nonribosomal peptide synthase n=1 Tax=Paenibacillus solanacearum TaxID=2048548 RepID=A0A916JR04_9BACL|nr:Dimodular nonribosomal peptide synthase [Paenibacillus solanacearum]
MLIASTVRRPLSGAQAGIWYAQQLDPRNPMYNTGEYVDIHGPVERTTFEAALRHVWLETEALHVRFEEDHEGPWQVFAPNAGWTLHVLDLSMEQAPFDQAKAWMDADLSRPCHLTEGPLFTEALLKIGPERYLWYQRMHHIVMDGYGFSLLTKRVAQVYTAMLQRQPYLNGGFESWQSVLDEDERYLNSDQVEADRRFWLDRFKDEPDACSLSDRTPRSAHRVLRQSAELSAAEASQLRQSAQLHNAVWSEVVLAAVASYVHRLTGAEDVILGLPMMSRLGSVSLNTPGMVMNIVPLRLHVRPAQKLSELVRQIAREIREVRKHQSYRHEELRRELKRVGDARRLFGSLVNIMPFDGRLQFNGVPGCKHNVSAGPVDDMEFNVYFNADGTGLHIDVDGNPEVYTEEELRAHHLRFIHYLGNVADAQPYDPIGGISLLDAEERTDGLTRWNRTARIVPPVRTVELFEAQALRSPNGIALVHEANEVDYAELNARANRLARFLIARGAGPRRIVAIAVPRSVEMIVSMLAVHKTGAGYLPLDIDFPADRIAYMVEDAQVLITLTTGDAAVKLPQPEAESARRTIIRLDDPAVQSELLGYAESNVEEPDRQGASLLTDPAYILYTSGSTGKPKGVVIPYAALTNFLLAMGEQFQLTADDRLLAITTISFDISILEIFMPLSAGHG